MLKAFTCRFSLVKKLMERVMKNKLYCIDKFVVIFAVDDNILNHVSLVTHVSSLWTKLEELYSRKATNNKLFLFK